jgi:chemotaxis protein methyltransferase CheR
VAEKMSPRGFKITETSAGHLRELLGHLASRVTGFDENSLRVGSIDKIIEDAAKRSALEDLLAQLSRESPELVEKLNDAVPVGETYFFRQPEHFRYLAREILPASRGALKVLSAGCATGEEAYSLSACLQASRVGRESEGLRVWGTDLSAHHLEIARQGLYGAWSVRQTEEASYPVFESSDHAPYRVRPELKEMTLFVQHNILHPIPEGPFDIIFCRNVLVYFIPDAARLALRNLASALKPGGILFLGPADNPSAPPGFKPHGPAGLSIYKKALSERPPKTAAAKPARKMQGPPFPVLKLKHPPIVPVSVEAKGPVAFHLRILEQMEKENDGEAGLELKKLSGAFPDYLPGLYESALWCARNGEARLAKQLMREVQKRLKALDPKETIPGPQDLTVDFYLISSRSFLDRGGI